MKVTRALPAKAMARANVPIITISLKTFTFSKCNSCIITVPKARKAKSSTPVLAEIHSLLSAEMNGDFDTPLMKMK